MPDFKSMFFNLVLMILVVKAEEEKKEEEEEEPFLGVLDYILLVVLGVGAVYWFFGRETKKEPSVQSYVIQGPISSNDLK